MIGDVGGPIRQVLVTGNLGYIGSILVPCLLERAYEVVGLDAGWYADDLLERSAGDDIAQIRGDVRDVTAADLKGIDAVVHLAALCNDPLGELDPVLTEDINHRATVHLAQLAKNCGVRRFVYSSSQSMYGVSETDSELDEGAPKHPVTAYACTKWAAEQGLHRLADGDFVTVALRPSTVFGASPRLRCDIVYNNLVGSAYTSGQIRIMSDGTPWRPVVHVRDVSAAFIAGLEAPADLVSGESFNVGIPRGNFTVRDLAEAAQRAVPGSGLAFTGEHGSDTRTYRVSFEKILTRLRPYFEPEWDLDRGGAELVSFFDRVGFTEEMFAGPRCNRLARIHALLDEGRIDRGLRWR